jgi:general secretion pathway protein A
MYNDYFGLTEAPFSIAPDPRFLYMSEQHREALAHLMFGVSSNGGFVLLTGEVGTGKTTVSRCLLEQLPEQTEVAFILNPKYSVLQLLAAICDDLHIEYNRSSEMKDYVDALN